MLVLSSVYAFADAEVKPPKVMVFSAEEIVPGGRSALFRDL